MWHLEPPKRLSLLANTPHIRSLRYYHTQSRRLPAYSNNPYWHYKKYLGIGPSAHSFNGYTRRWNVSNNKKYVEALLTNNTYFEEEILTPENKFNEYIMIKLRLQNGIDKTEMLAKYNTKWCNAAFEVLTAAKNKNLVHQNDSHIFLTNEGKFFADGLAAACFV